jgi:hypothetical protein
VASHSFDVSIDLEVHAMQEQVGSDAKRNSVSDRSFKLNPEYTHSRHLMRRAAKEGCNL